MPSRAIAKCSDNCLQNKAITKRNNYAFSQEWIKHLLKKLLNKNTHFLGQAPLHHDLTYISSDTNLFPHT